MRIKLRYPDLETFIQKYAVNISRGGIFIATKQPKPVGTALKFEFLLATGDTAVSIIRGEGQVLWTREFDPEQPTKAHGMGVRFTKLDSESQAVVDRALAYRAQLGGDRKEGSGLSPLPPSPTQSRVVPTAPPAPFGPPPTPVSAPVEAAAPKPPPTPPPPTPPPLIPEMRRPVDETRPLTMASGGEAQPHDEHRPGRAPDQTTKPVTLPEAEAEVRAMRDEPYTGETALPTVRPAPRVNLSVERDPSREIRIRGEIPDDLDALAREWGISDEQIDRVLKRARPRLVEATAELERLLRKPAKGPAPSRAEALAGLKELLERGSPVLEIAVDPARKRAR